MSYATAVEFRSRFLTELADEFDRRTNGELDGYLGGASATIDAYIPPGPYGARATVVLKEACMVIARVLVHDITLDDTHPAIIAYNEKLDWLKKIQTGDASLPTDGNEETDPAFGEGRPAVAAPDARMVETRLTKQPGVEEF